MKTTNRKVKGNDFNFAELKTKNTISDCKNSKMGLVDIYTHQEDASLNYCTLFQFYYNRIPNFIHEVELDCEKPTFGLPILLRMKSKIGIITSEIFQSRRSSYPTSYPFERTYISQ